MSRNPSSHHPSHHSSSAPAAASTLSARVLKALGVFGGVKVVYILCAIVRTKAVALWIGTVGVGLFGIFQSAADLIGTIASMGLGTTVTREIASATPAGRPRVLRATYRLAFLLAIFSALLTLIMAPLLSLWAFGDETHTGSFRLLALLVFTLPFLGAHIGVLQGYDRLRLLARASAGGSVAGLVVALPLYYFYGREGIVPSMIAYGVTMAAFAWVYAYRAVPLADRSERPALPAAGVEGATAVPSLMALGSRLFRLGAYITFSQVFSYTANYAFISWLNLHASTSDVGCFQAANTLMNNYVGLIFSALMVEFYPRISAASASPRRLATFVNHEVCLVMPVLALVLPMFVGAAPMLVRLLYSDAFLSVVPMVSVGILASVLRALSNIMAYVILARGDGRIYLVTEGASAITYLLVCIPGWLVGGLTGVGVAFVVWYVTYALVVWMVYRRRFNLTVAPRAIRLTLVAAATTIGALALVILLPYGAIGNILAVAIPAAASLKVLPRLLKR